MDGLEKDAKYSISIRFVSSDNLRYKYVQRRWVPFQQSEAVQDSERMSVKHSDSPHFGSYWMRQPINFASVKITHYALSKFGDVSIIIIVYYRRHAIIIFISSW